MNILVFGASNSSKSINKRFATYTASLIEDANITLIDLNDFEMPIYSLDREENDGIPAEAVNFKALISSSDSIVISFAEHNGSYSTAFKNIMDWVSRIKGDTWEGKAFFLLSTSPGGRGGKTVLNAARVTFQHMGAQVKAYFSLPRFYQNFSEEGGIKDQELNQEFQHQLRMFLSND